MQSQHHCMRPRHQHLPAPCPHTMSQSGLLLTRASGLSGPHTPVRPDSNKGASVEIVNGGSQDSEPTTPSRPQSLPTLMHVHSTQLSYRLDQPSQSLQTRVVVPLATRLDLPGWQEDRPLPQQRDARDLDGATPRQRSSSTYSPTYSPLSPSATCVQDSPQALANPVVASSDLTQVTDLLALFAGVASTTPAAV